MHNINACFTSGQPPEDVTMDEYTDLYFMAREDFAARVEADLLKIKIHSVERVNWNDSSLGLPEPDMMYMQVITPGYKLVLDAQGERALYHTSTSHVVFADDKGDGAPVAGGGQMLPPSPISVPTAINGETDGSECDLVHNINACFTSGQPPEGVALSEYTDLYLKAREDYAARVDADPITIKIHSIERVEWNDSSLGLPQPGMMYLMVITPGFKLVLDAQDERATYHTSTSHVVFADDQENVGNTPTPVASSISPDDLTGIVEVILDWALVEQSIPDYNLLIANQPDIILSVSNIEDASLPVLAGLDYLVLTEAEIQDKANAEGNLLRLRFDSITVKGDSAEVSINNTWVKAKDSDVMFLSGGGCQLTLHRVNGTWTIDEQHMCWIS